jgi:hypothetical protein
MKQFSSSLGVIALSREVASQFQGLAVASLTMNVPIAPFANFSTAAAVSSTGKPRVLLEAVACTLSISPTTIRRQSMSWIALIRIGPPPASRRHVTSK